MNRRVALTIKAIVFLIVGTIIFIICNFIFQPIWDTTNYGITSGFYEEPSNTIETVFLGSSHVRGGINTMQLYEDYGICSYDLSTDGQSLSSSYYWLEEIYRHHSETMDTVVLDVSMLRREATANFGKTACRFCLDRSTDYV